MHGRHPSYAYTQGINQCHRQGDLIRPRPRQQQQLRSHSLLLLPLLALLLLLLLGGSPLLGNKIMRGPPGLLLPAAVHAQCPVCAMQAGSCTGTTINLQSLGLTAIDTTWFNHADCSTYTLLYLNNNLITSIPAGVFGQLTSLVYLHLYGSQITSIPASIFDQLTSLQQLYLGNNLITSIAASVFDQLTSLQVLHLNNNQITSIPASIFDQLTSLDWLRLDTNQLTSLPTGIFDPFFVLPLNTLEVGANPWNCSTDPSAVVVPSPGVTGCPGNSVLCATCGSGVNQASKADTGSMMMSFLLAGASVVAVLRTI